MASSAWNPFTRLSFAVEIVDTLALARERFPGKKNNLDSLCERFGVANAHRTLHGALLDAQLLAEVYLAMTRGQEILIMDIGLPERGMVGVNSGASAITARRAPSNLPCSASLSFPGRYSKATPLPRLRAVLRSATLRVYQYSRGDDGKSSQS